MTHKMAIIGYGGMGSWHCSNIRKKIPQIEVKGIYDIREEAISKAKLNDLHIYESLEALINDKEIELVTIATPNNFHKTYTIACLNAGKNVVCEKPVAMNSGEVAEMIEAAKKAGKIFSVHQNRRWDKDYKIIKKIIADESIGKPYFIESRVQGSRRSLHGWRGHKINGGGMLLDWGIHLLDQIMDLVDSQVVSVYAHVLSIFNPEVDDNIKIFLLFKNNVSALVEVSTNCFINLPRWHVSCSEGTAIIEDWVCNGKMVKLNTDSQMEWDDEIIYTEAGPTRTMAPRPVHTTENLKLPEITTDWSDYYNNIALAIDGKADLIVKPEQALRVMNVVDKIFESGKAGHSISCEI